MIGATPQEAAWVARVIDAANHAMRCPQSLAVTPRDEWPRPPAAEKPMRGTLHEYVTGGIWC